MDFNKPYGEVYGLPGAVYEQGGHYFRSDGKEAIDAKPIEDNEPASEAEDILPPVCCIEQPTVPFESTTGGHHVEDMPSKLLRAMVENYGGEWTNRKAAIAFMKGKK